MAVVFAHGRSQLLTAGATQTFSASLGGINPVLALFRLSGADVQASAAQHAAYALGVTDGTNDACFALSAPDSDTLIEQGRKAAQFGNPGNVDNTDGQAVRAYSRSPRTFTTGPEFYFDSWVTDGVRLTIDRVSDQPYFLDYILIGGADLSVDVQEIDAFGSQGGSQNVTALGVPADLVMCWRARFNIPTTTTSTFDISEGFWSRSAHSSAPNGCHVATSFGYDPGVDDESKPRQDVRDDSIGSDIVWGSGGTPPLNRLGVSEHASGYTIDYIDAVSSGRDAIWIAMNFNNAKRAWVGVEAIGTSTPQNIETPLLTPDLVMGVATRRTDRNATVTESPEGGTADSAVMSGCVGIPGVTSGGAAAATYEHGLTVTNAHSFADDRFLLVPNEDGTLGMGAIRATMGAAITGRGFTLNYTDTDIAGLMALMVIGEDQTLAPDPVAVTLVEPSVTMGMALAPDPVVVNLNVPTHELLGPTLQTPDPVIVAVAVPAAFTGFILPDPVIINLSVSEPILIIPPAPAPPPAELGDAYRNALLDLLPRGKIWERRTSTNIAALMRALGEELANLERRGDAAIEEADPRTTSELIAEWEELLGIAEDCGGVETVLTFRQAAIVAKYTSPGGQNSYHYSEVAKALGYDVEISDIEEYQQFRVGSSTVGERLSNGPWVFTWTVHAPVATPFFFRAGESRAGDPLQSATNVPLECTLDKVKPSHTLVTFEYDQPYTGYAPWQVLQPTPVVIDVTIPNTLVSVS